MWEDICSYKSKMKWMTQLMALSVAFVLSDAMVYMVLKWKGQCSGKRNKKGTSSEKQDASQEKQEEKSFVRLWVEQLFAIMVHSTHFVHLFHLHLSVFLLFVGSPLFVKYADKNKRLCK